MGARVGLLLIVVLGIAVAQECTEPPRDDRRCGAAFGNARCRPGQCCSRNGRCGSSSSHCNPRSRCAREPAVVSEAAVCSAPPLTSGRCGPDFGNAGCSDGECCSPSAWCGTTPAHCNSRSLCPAATTTPAVQPQRQQHQHQRPSRRQASSSDGPIRAMSSCGNSRRMVALTFDDGPTPGATEPILEVLADHNIKATFYLTEDNTGPAGCPLIRRLLREGHMIAHHSKSHPQFNLPSTNLRREMESPVAWIAACGVDPGLVTHFRPPYGQLRDDQVQEISGRMGFVIDLWNVETMDSDDGNTNQESIENVKRAMRTIGVGNSAVVLMHDYAEGPRIVDAPDGNALVQIIEYFRSLRYRFVRMDECYAQCDAPRCFGNGGPTHWASVFDPDPNGVGTFPAE
ncbi:NodB homology domain-containing protein [Plasmodiophora brassicae]